MLQQLQVRHRLKLSRIKAFSPASIGLNPAGKTRARCKPGANPMYDARTVAKAFIQLPRNTSRPIDITKL